MLQGDDQFCVLKNSGTVISSEEVRHEIQEQYYERLYWTLTIDCEYVAIDYLDDEYDWLAPNKYPFEKQPAAQDEIEEQGVLDGN